MTLPQLKDVLQHMSTVLENVDTLITTSEGQVFEPGDDLAVWFTSTQHERKYRQFRGSMLVHKFAVALAKLLPDGTSHAKKVLAMNRPPASLCEVMEDTGGRTLASLKKELVKGHVRLEKATKKCGIWGQVWWATSGDKKGSRSCEVNVVHKEKESLAIQAIMKGMEAMQVTVAALAAAQASGSVLPKIVPTVGYWGSQGGGYGGGYRRQLWPKYQGIQQQRGLQWLQQQPALAGRPAPAPAAPAEPEPE